MIQIWVVSGVEGAEFDDHNFICICKFKRVETGQSSRDGESTAALVQF